MSRSLIHWSDTDESALSSLQGRLQSLCPGRTLSRPDVVKLAITACASRVTCEELLTAQVAHADTLPPTIIDDDTGHAAADVCSAALLGGKGRGR